LDVVARKYMEEVTRIVKMAEWRAETGNVHETNGCDRKGTVRTFRKDVKGTGFGWTTYRGGRIYKK
jgi:hypothetical protein